MKTKQNIIVIGFGLLLFSGCVSEKHNPTLTMMQETRNGISFFKDLAEIEMRNNPSIDIKFWNIDGKSGSIYLKGHDSKNIIEMLLAAEIGPADFTGKKGVMMSLPPVSYVLSMETGFPEDGLIENEITLFTSSLVYLHHQYATMNASHRKEITQKLKELIKERLISDEEISIYEKNE